MNRRMIHPVIVGLLIVGLVYNIFIQMRFSSAGKECEDLIGTWTDRSNSSKNYINFARGGKVVLFNQPELPHDGKIEATWSPYGHNENPLALRFTYIIDIENSANERTSYDTDIKFNDPNCIVIHFPNHDARTLTRVTDGRQL